MVFLLTYLAIHGGMTAYFLYKLWRGFGGSCRSWCPACGAAVVLVLMPLVLHRLEGRLGEWPARLLANAGWIWLALAFWGFCAFVATDLWNLLSSAGVPVWPGFARVHLSPRGAARGVLWALAGLCTWGWFEAGWVRVKTVETVSPRLPAGQPPLRLLQISDMHVGRTARRRVWERVLRQVAEARPDVIVSTGDLIDASDAFVAEWLAAWRDLVPAGGAYAVLGNHEVYPGVDRCVALLEGAGFRVLRDEAVALTPGVRLVGVDDPAVRRQAGGRASTGEAELLPGERDGFTLLLKHQPIVSTAARAGVDLQLSGHSHQGQIFPFGGFVRLVHPHPHSRPVTFPEGLRLYVSRGTGTWGPPFRVLAPPELTLHVLRPARPGE